MPTYKVLISNKDKTPITPNCDVYESNCMCEDEETAVLSALSSLGMLERARGEMIIDVTVVNK